MAQTTGPSASPGEERQRQLRYSRAEMLRHKDFSACSEDELAEAMELLRSRPAISCRPSHRWEPGPAGSPARRAGHHAPRHALRRRGGPHPAPRALTPRPPARGPVRRQWLDGALRPRHVALRPRPRGRAVARRGLRDRDTPHAIDQGAVLSRPRCCHDDRGSGGPGLVGGYTTRRGSARVQRSLRRSRHGPGIRGHRDVRRMGSWRSRGAAARRCAGSRESPTGWCG